MIVDLTTFTALSSSKIIPTEEGTIQIVFMSKRRKSVVSLAVLYKKRKLPSLPRKKIGVM